MSITQVSSRSALEALTPSAGDCAYLTELGREGVFAWSSANLSAYVTADAQQGIYVAPAADTTGASGAWVRKFSGPLDIGWFGAVADCTSYGVGTDNSPAINGAKAVAKLLGNGAAILIPKAAAGYRCASTINFTEGVQLLGEGWHQNPGVVNGVSYTAPNNYRGSVLVFDSDVAGLKFTAASDQPANAIVWQYESSVYSIVRDLMLLSQGGTGTTGHGVDVRASLRFSNVRITGFAGNGLNIVANTAGSSQYGNADCSNFHALTCDGNKLHGVLLSGDDANVVSFTGSCSFRNNGGCGTLDLTTVGNNTFNTAHYATNNRSHPTNSASGYSSAQRNQVLADAPCLSDNMTGSAVQYRSAIYDNTDIGNLSLYEDCYTEGGSGSLVRLRSFTQVIGGFFGQVGSRHSEYNALTINYTELRGIGNFYGTGNSFNFYDHPLTITRSASDATIPYLSIKPTNATYSQLKMLGNGGSATLGLDLLAGNQNAYFSCDNFTFRNAAQSTIYATFKSTGLVVSSGGITTSGGAIGYATGAGGAVTQATSKSTGVTLNKVCGQITMNAAALVAGTGVSFTVTNSQVAATDTIDLVLASGNATAGTYNYQIDKVRAGSFVIWVKNISAGSLSEALVFNFAVKKAVNA